MKSFEKDEPMFKYKGQKFHTVVDMFNYASEYLNAELSAESISLACEEMVMRIWGFIQRRDIKIKNKEFLKLIEDLSIILIEKISETKKY